MEPFCGSCSVVGAMTGPRIAHDINPHLIALWQAVQAGLFNYPEAVSEKIYRECRSRKAQAEPDPLLAFIGFGCSFGGKWFGGFARGKDDGRIKDYCRIAADSLCRKAVNLRGVEFFCKDYRSLIPRGCLIYCDPPYRGTTKYQFSGSFNSDEFWETMRRWSADNTVVVSEFAAPADFQQIAEFPSLSMAELPPVRLEPKNFSRIMRNRLT